MTSTEMSQYRRDQQHCRVIGEYIAERLETLYDWHDGSSQRGPRAEHDRVNGRKRIATLFAERTGLAVATAETILTNYVKKRFTAQISAHNPSAHKRSITPLHLSRMAELFALLDTPEHCGIIELMKEINPQFEYSRTRLQEQ